jgi:hypothetical protein
VLLVLIVLVVAAFGAWRYQYLRAETAERSLQVITRGKPAAVLEVTVDGSNLYLAGRNVGAQGTFRATLETEGDTNVLQPVPALWDQPMTAEPFEIAPGISSRLRLATLSEDRRTRFDNEGNEIP